jgi:hypothetical protein
MKKNIQEILKTESLDDHSERFNVQKDILDQANQKMKDMGLDTEIKDDYIVTKKSNEDIDSIWEAFLESEEPDFKEKMGYGKEDIEKIGAKEFINFMDWSKTSDITKWRSDLLHVVPCCDCEKKFSVLENLGLCPKCMLAYDLEKVQKEFTGLKQNHQYSVAILCGMFHKSKAYRGMFRKESEVLNGESTGH